MMKNINLSNVFIPGITAKCFLKDVINFTPFTNLLSIEIRYMIDTCALNTYDLSNIN